MKGLRKQLEAAKHVQAPSPAPDAPKQPKRGKHFVGGYFTAQVAQAVKVLAAQQGRSVQALVGEAIDMQLERGGQKGFGER